MYSKNVGDFDVHLKDEKYEQLICYSSFGRPRTFECGLQTDLFDTKRHVGYIDRELKGDDEDMIEEQRQEIITFRLPLEARITEEIYETTIVTETKQNHQQIEEVRRKIKPDNFLEEAIQNETTERVRPLDGTRIKSSIDNKQQQPKQQQEKKRSSSPEDFVEESYEVITTLQRLQDGDIFITATNPRSTIVQRSTDLSKANLQSSEDDSPYCEEWTVTEAKSKRDGQIIKTMIER